MPLQPRMNLAPYVVTRSQENPPVDGRPVAPTTSTVNIIANMQPAPGEKLEVLPEARSVDDARILYTATLLKSGNGDGYLPDIVTIAGERYEVVSVGGWPGHYEVVVSKL